MEVCTVYKLYRIVIIQKIGDSFWLSSKSFLPVSDSQLLTLHTLKKIVKLKKKTRPVIKIMVIPLAGYKGTYLLAIGIWLSVWAAEGACIGTSEVVIANKSKFTSSEFFLGFELRSSGSL